jgi:hypothetical protein
MPEIYDFEQQAPFLKLEEVSDGDIVVFDNEGRLVDDKWGSNRLQMDIILPNKEVRKITVNKTSQRNLAAKFGSSTYGWVNKPVVVKKEKVLLGGKTKEALILYPQ